MITYHEWIEAGDLLESQLEQLIVRIEGLLHNTNKEKKIELIDKLMRQLEERILGM